jgi:transcriptional regulator with XRE-family HTH domain
VSAGEAPLPTLRAVDDARLGMAIRAVRLRRRWTQRRLGAEAGVSESTVSRAERGRVDALSVGSIRAICAALGVRLELLPRTPGADLERMINARHAALAEEILRRVKRFDGWTARPEVSFSVYGERGIVDLLAWHVATRSLLVVELKTAIVDVGEVLGTLDRKVRLAGRIAEPLGWSPANVAAWLAIGESMTSRRRVAAHDGTFRAALPDGPAALRRWLRSPTGSVRALTFVTDRHQPGVTSRFASLSRVPTRPGPSRHARAVRHEARGPATRASWSAERLSRPGTGDDL